MYYYCYYYKRHRCRPCAGARTGGTFFTHLRYVCVCVHILEKQFLERRVLNRQVLQYTTFGKTAIYSINYYYLLTKLHIGVELL